MLTEQDMKRIFERVRNEDLEDAEPTAVPPEFSTLTEEQRASLRKAAAAFQQRHAARFEAARQRRLQQLADEAVVFEDEHGSLELIGSSSYSADMADAQDTKSAPLPTKQDAAAGGIAVLVLILSALKLPSKLGMTADELAMLLGLFGVLLGAARAWWEGKQRAEGGSLVDPVGALAAAIVAILGYFHVLEKAELTADQAVGLISLGFGQLAGVRAWLRSRFNKKLVAAN